VVLACLVTSLTPARAAEVGFPGGLQLPNRRDETGTVVSGPSSRDGLLVLHNGSPDRVKVEVRIGPSKNCTTNDRFATVVLGPDEWWSFITPDVICWRRERAPDHSAAGQSAASWTDWQPTQVPADTKQEVEL
jgi:hypothetical protein